MRDVDDSDLIEEETSYPGIAHRRLAAIVTSSNDAIISMTLSGDIQTWNGSAEKMFGYAASEIVGQSIRTLAPPDRQQEEDDILRRVIHGEQVQNFETIRRHKSGLEIPVSVTVSPIRDDAGAIVGASKILRDISLVRATVKQLEESEARLRTLADNIAQFVWMADSSGYIFWYNKRWYDYTGTTFEDMKGWGWRSVHHPDHVDRVVRRIQHSWDTGELWEDTFPLLGADGQFRWFLSRAIPIHDETGRIVRWFGSNTDVTDQKEYEERINLLLGEVNHRSKNMLALVQAIARQTSKTESVSEFVERFNSRLSALAASQDVLVSSGWRGADVETLVKGQLAHFHDLIGSRITLAGPSVVLTAKAAESLGMVIHELATNAGKYGSLSNDDGCVAISWRVTPDETGAQLFSFAWIESGGPPVEPPTRTGFGSYVVGKMTEMAFGARVEADYSPDGLAWRMHCRDGRALESAATDASAPVASEPIAAPEPAAPDPPILRVLLVEDEAIIGADFALGLASEGFEVIGPAATVDEALQLLNEYHCDLAVLDVNLGRETSERVAEKLRDSATPFVAVTGYAVDQLPEAFSGAPCLSKPCNCSSLARLLRSQWSVARIQSQY